MGQKTPDPANHLGRYLEGSELCTNDSVVYNINGLTEVQKRLNFEVEAHESDFKTNSSTN